MPKIVVDLSESNAGKKRRRRERNIDKVDGDHLAHTAPKVTRAGIAKRVADKLKPQRGLHAMGDSLHNDSEEYQVRELITLSSDVIFNPATQSTRYSASREAKRNLERRMAGYEIDVMYGSGEGMVRFYAKSSHTVVVGNNGVSVTIMADCLASPTDMAIHRAEIVCGDRTFEVEPADRALFPEEAVKVLSRIAENVVRNM
jgi:hypothetical protein